MSPLDWKEQPQDTASYPSSNDVTPWFGVAVGLMGLIAGFIFGTFLQ